MKLKIAHLYPDLLDLYGDRGNIITLTQRCRWRGIEAEVMPVSIGNAWDLSSVDILFLGGGSDREQGLLVEDLMRRKDDLKYGIADGLVILSICGGYQLLGDYYQTMSGEKIPGLGLLNLWTIAGKERMIGNMVVELDEQWKADLAPGAPNTLVGFENHAGQTYLGAGLNPLGKVKTGWGNNGKDGMEGLRVHNVFGTYLHGPLLPKNPHLADCLLRLALERRGYDISLEALDDRLEHLAHQAVVQRFSA